MMQASAETLPEPLVARRGLVFSRDIEDYPGGIIFPIDKPWRWTSADVIRKLKWAACRHFGSRSLKVGHAGTLDPLATGVLLVCVGKATKLAESLQREEKEYLAGVDFGATTPSYDREKDIDRRFACESVTPEALERVLQGFKGPQEQVAPLFSAKSVDGVRAYEMARREYKAAALAGGGEFDHSAAALLTRQQIVIYDISLEGWEPQGNTVPIDTLTGEDALLRPNPRINVIETCGLGLPRATIRVSCSKGTYIRALARDLGEALGSGAFLDSLRRTRSGGFSVSDALSLPDALSLL